MRARWRNILQNSTAVTLAVLLHATVAVLLILNLDNLLGSRTAPPEPGVREVVEATVIDQARLDEELQKLIEADRRKQEEQQARQAELERAVQEAREQRRQEERRLADLQRKQAEERQRRKEEQAQLEVERRAEQQRLEELRRQQSDAKRIAEESARAAKEEEAKRLEAEKRRQEAEQKAAEAKRRAEEVARKAKEEEQRRKAEQARKAEEERKAEEAARKAEEAARKAEEARLAEERKRLQELMAKEQRERAARDQALKDLVSQYGSLIRQRVERSWILPYEGTRNLSCMLRITLMDSGEVSRVDVVNSSGDAGFDRSAVAAVHRASPLPLPSDTEALAAFRSFNFLFKPGG